MLARSFPLILVAGCWAIFCRETLLIHRIQFLHVVRTHATASPLRRNALMTRIVIQFGHLRLELLQLSLDVSTQRIRVFNVLHTRRLLHLTLALLGQGGAPFLFIFLKDLLVA